MTPRVLRRIFLALVVVTVLWGALSLVRRGSRDRETGGGLPVIDTAAIDLIALRQVSDTIVAVRQGKQWRVNGFPGSTEHVAAFLAAFSDTGSHAELVAEQPASHARLGVDSPSGRRLELGAAGGLVASLILGKRGPDFEGVYLRPNGTDAVYLLRGRLTDLLLDDLDRWREHRILALPADSIGRVELSAGRTGWVLARQGGGWVWDGRAADSIKVRRYLGQFRDIRATGFDAAGGADPGGGKRLLGRLLVIQSPGGAVLARLSFEGDSAGFRVGVEGESAGYRIPAATAELLAPAVPDLAP